MADSLGITVDPEYNVGAAGTFDMKAVVNNVVTLCRSEAAERHINVQVQLPDSEIKAWGDARGVQIALMHLILNAIKYGKGASTIVILVTDTALAGVVWAHGLELRLLLGELAVLFILFPAAFYGTIYYIHWKWWRRNRRGVCGSCGPNPKTQAPGGLCAECMRGITKPVRSRRKSGVFHVGGRGSRRAESSGPAPARQEPRPTAFTVF